MALSAQFRLIRNSVFLPLSNVSSCLPSYEEQVQLLGMDLVADYTRIYQRKVYGVIFDTLLQEWPGPWPRVPGGS